LLFFPGEAHRPSITVVIRWSKKIVIKIKMAKGGYGYQIYAGTKPNQKFKNNDL